MRKLPLIAAAAIASGACSPPPSPGKAELTATPNPVNFGQVDVDQTATKQVTVRNIGAVDVTLTSTVGAGSLFTVPAGNLFIAAGDSTQATLRFRPNRVATMTDEWVLAPAGEEPLLRLTLRGEGVVPCNDADNDGATANCATATDCDDSDRAVHPGAFEVCNGLDDDCDPLTVEACDAGVDPGQDAGSDAGPADAGPTDAGACTCTDNPNDCTGVNPCVRDGGAPVCTTFDLPDTTACVRSAGDGGAGVCQAASCVECITATDCVALNPNATACDLLTCNAGRCESQRRHDSTAWRVTPPLGAELLLNGSATPLKAMWDGQNFAVAVTTFDGGAVVRRVSRAGAIIDPVGYRLNPRVKDIAWSGDRFLQVTEEPANGGAQPFDYVAGSYLSYDGGANSASQPIIWDTGSTNPLAHFVTPSVAGSSQGSFMVIAQASQYFWSKWRQLPGGSAGELTTPMRPRSPVLTGSANGYSLATQENSIGSGNAEVGGAFYGRTTGDTGYAVRAPYTPADVVRGTECCTQGARLATNGSSFLLAYTWGGVTALYRPYDVALQPTAPPTEYPLGGATYGTGQTIELGSDGVNFLLVQAPSATTLRVIRVTPSGIQLDTPTFDVSSADSNVESRPRLASDGQGRNLLAYQKVEGAQTNTYVRLFTTCP